MKLYKTVNKKARAFIENRTLRIGSLSYYKILNQQILEKMILKEFQI